MPLAAFTCLSCAGSATHAHEKAVKWKKSGSPQLRDMGAQCPGVQVMSQFAVARGLTDNSKAFSARVSCAVRVGEAQGIHLVQVRAAEVPVGGGAGGGGKSTMSGPREAATARAGLYPPVGSMGGFGGPTSGLASGMSGGGIPNMSASFHQLLASYGTPAASAAQYSRLLAGQPWGAYGGASSTLPPASLLLYQQQQQQALAGLTGAGTAASYAAAIARASALPGARAALPGTGAFPADAWLGAAPALPHASAEGVTVEAKDPAAEAAESSTASAAAAHAASGTGGC